MEAEADWEDAEADLEDGEEDWEDGEEDWEDGAEAGALLASSAAACMVWRAEQDTSSRPASFSSSSRRQIAEVYIVEVSKSVLLVFEEGLCAPYVFDYL